MQIYDSPEKWLKINSVFEFTEVLTLNSDATEDKYDSNEFSNGFFADELIHSPC